MIDTFKLSPTEKERAKQFIQEHKNCATPTAIGGYIDYIFTPTSIGTAVRLYCSACTKEENITDYDVW